MSINHVTAPTLLRMVDKPSERLDFWPGSARGLSKYPTLEEGLAGLERLVQNALPASKSFNTSPPRLAILDFDPRDCRAVNDPASRNCTKSCSDLESLFIPTNLRPCLMIAGAASLVQNQMAMVDRSDGESNATIDSLNIPELSTFDATWVFTSFLQCLEYGESCANPNPTMCPFRDYSHIPVPWNMTNLSSFGRGLGTKLCSGAYMYDTINADLAGPGVAVSYLLQSGLALCLYLLGNICISWTRNLRAPRFLKSYRQTCADFSMRLQGKFKRSRFGVAAISSLAEFQEIQIYFVISLQVAALFTHIEADTFGTAMLAISVVRALSILSIAPVLLVQLCLVRACKNWWYTFLAMSTAFIMSVSVFRYYTFMPTWDPDALWAKLKHEGALPACGGSPNPRFLCMTWVKKQTPNLKVFKTAAAICVAAWSRLVYEKVTSSCSIPLSPRLQRLLKPLGQPLKVLAYTVEVSLVGATIYYSVYVYSALWNATRRPELSGSLRWDFGQFVAVMIWAPTIAKFVYFISFGIKSGFEARIAEPYMITTKQELSDTANICHIDSFHSSSFISGPGSGFLEIIRFLCSFASVQTPFQNAIASPLGVRAQLVTGNLGSLVVRRQGSRILFINTPSPIPMKEDFQDKQVIESAKYSS
ncbi:hypothetical protein QBC43DRAFT_335215 [Cladorrhinum sp. PSN259]|nr:hypothetical protein QBC43DRAFT_335215 [Cladorrhinum sp. PSN259]